MHEDDIQRGHRRMKARLNTRAIIRRQLKTNPDYIADIVLGMLDVTIEEAAEHACKGLPAYLHGQWRQAKRKWCVKSYADLNRK